MARLLSIWDIEDPKDGIQWSQKIRLSRYKIGGRTAYLRLGVGAGPFFTSELLASHRRKLPEAQRPIAADGRESRHAGMTPSDLPTFAKEAAARATCSGECAAESWTRMRASPLGTTGNENPTT